MLYKVLFFAVILQVYIYAQGSYLNISIYDDSEFYITFDDKSYSEPGNYAELDPVSPGEHTLKVILYDASMSAMGNVLYDGKIKIPSGFDLYTVIDEFNSIVIYKKVKYGVNRCECVSDTRKKIGAVTGEVIKEKEVVSGECKYKIIKPDDFKELKHDINNRSFESTNLSIVKTAIDKNFFSSEQIKEILSYFTFENNKVEIAKYSYKKICDKNNFFKVYDAFNFESSIEEIKNYISDK